MVSIPMVQQQGEDPDHTDVLDSYTTDLWAIVSTVTTVTISDDSNASTVEHSQEDACTAYDEEEQQNLIFSSFKRLKMHN